MTGAKLVSTSTTWFDAVLAKIVWIDNFKTKYHESPKYDNKSVAVASEIPSSLLLWPPSWVKYLHDLRLQEEYYYEYLQIFARESSFIKLIITCIS